jgi:hypothetical protein
VGSTIEPTPATRAEYQRVLCLLPLVWPQLVRDHPMLTSDAFYVLTQLLVRQPGRVMRQGVRVPRKGKRPGFAEELGWRRGRVLRALNALRDAGLVLTVLYTQADELPTGSGAHSRSNICRYFVVTSAIDPGPQLKPSDGSPNGPSTGSLGTSDLTTPTPPRPRKPRRPRLQSQAPTAPHHVASETPPSAPEALPHSETPAAPKTESLGGKEEQAASQVSALCRQWEALGLRNANGTESTCRASEQSAIAHRIADIGPELVELAVVGAGADPWLRRGGPRSALAWVMNDAASVRRYAERGAEIRRGAANARREKLASPHASNDAPPFAAPTVVSIANAARSKPTPKPSTTTDEGGGAPLTLKVLARGIGGWIEPPACHDASCGECERCKKRAPISRTLFRDMREAARTSGAAHDAFARETNEARERELHRRRLQAIDDAQRLERQWAAEAHAAAVSHSPGAPCLSVYTKDNQLDREGRGGGGSSATIGETPPVVDGADAMREDPGQGGR